MRKYAESKKRRKNRRKLSKRYYTLCIRNIVSDGDFMWIENTKIKSKNTLIQVLNKIIVDENMNRLMSAVAKVYIITFHNKERGGRPVSSESLSLTKEKTIKEHIKDYIFEQRCMIRSRLPQDLVRMLYTFL
jgi:hypothetical protein